MSSWTCYTLSTYETIPSHSHSCSLRCVRGTILTVICETPPLFFFTWCAGGCDVCSLPDSADPLRLGNGANPALLLFHNNFTITWKKSRNCGQHVRIRWHMGSAGMGSQWVFQSDRPSAFRSHFHRSSYQAAIISIVVVTMGFSTRVVNLFPTVSFLQSKLRKVMGKGRCFIFRLLPCETLWQRVPGNSLGLAILS